MGKHAYLIMAHNQVEVLRVLIELIDDVRNDIFLHVDKKADFSSADIMDVPRKSKIYMVSSLDVKWGAPSQIKCSLSLFQKACETEKYDYYHLLSGVDLPLKTQDQIHDFFELNRGKQFVSFDDDNLIGNAHRVRYKWYLQEKKGYKEKNIFNVMDKAFIWAQKIFRADFRDKNIQYKLGSEWCSLSDDFVRYLVDSQEEIHRLFGHSAAGDEMYIQTMLYNSEDYKAQLYEENIKEANLRYINFGNGWASPQIIRKEDIPHLLHSKYLFARKFDYETNPDAVELIKKELLQNKEIAEK